MSGSNNAKNLYFAVAPLFQVDRLESSGIQVESRWNSGRFQIIPVDSRWIPVDSTWIPGWHSLFQLQSTNFENIPVHSRLVQSIPPQSTSVHLIFTYIPVCLDCPGGYFQPIQLSSCPGGQLLYFSKFFSDCPVYPGGLFQSIHLSTCPVVQVDNYYTLSDFFLDCSVVQVDN